MDDLKRRRFGYDGHQHPSMAKLIYTWATFTLIYNLPPKLNHAINHITQ